MWKYAPDQAKRARHNIYLTETTKEYDNISNFQEYFFINKKFELVCSRNVIR